ncbi:MAG: acetyltransferase [Phycisphaerales bacterium]|jgi:UDP-perosamine 4-acetyltransferase|nr:acetyltransferase [Phycisphaerales bacterium]
METLIIGAGGHGRVVLDILRAAGQYTPVGFIDSDPTLAGTQVMDLDVLGDINLLPKLRKQNISRAIVAIGDNRNRLTQAQFLLEHGFELINAIHPTSRLCSGVQIGRNVVIAAGAIVCTQSTLADSTIINTGAIVDHECRIEAGSHIAPGAILAGRVRVEQGAFVGIGARIIQNLTIGSFAIVGAGAVVLEDVPLNATVVGVPARQLPSSNRTVTA